MGVGFAPWQFGISDHDDGLMTMVGGRLSLLVKDLFAIVLSLDLDSGGLNVDLTPRLWLQRL